MEIKNISFNLADVSDQPRRATTPMLALVRRLCAATPSLTAPRTTDFDTVSAWIDDVIGVDPLVPPTGLEHYLMAAGGDDVAGSVEDVTQFQTGEIGC